MRILIQQDWDGVQHSAFLTHSQACWGCWSADHLWGAWVYTVEWTLSFPFQIWPFLSPLPSKSTTSSTKPLLVILLISPMTNSRKAGENTDYWVSPQSFWFCRPGVEGEECQESGHKHRGRWGLVIGDHIFRTTILGWWFLNLAAHKNIRCF